MNIVKDLRIKKGIQQKELALTIGVSQPTVSEWESNKIDPTGERLKKLAAFFEVDELVILGRAPLPQTLYVPTDPKLCGKSETEQIVERILQQLGDQPKTPEARLLAKGVDSMPADQRKAIVNMMVGLRPDIFKKGLNDDDT